MSITRALSSNGFISVNKTFIQKFGLEAAAIIGELCSEYDYYDERGKLEEDGSFYSTIKNIEEKLGIKEKKQRLIFKELELAGIIKVYKRGMPSKRYVKINENVLLESLKKDAKSDSSVRTSSANLDELYPPIEATNNNCINNNINNNNKKQPSIDYKSIEEALINLETLPTFTKLTEKRKQMINGRLSEYTVEDIMKAIDNAGKSDFIKQEQAKGKNWFTFDWLFGPKNFVKVLEGNYNKHLTNPSQNNGYRQNVFNVNNYSSKQSVQAAAPQKELYLGE